MQHTPNVFTPDTIDHVRQTVRRFAEQAAHWDGKAAEYDAAAAKARDNAAQQRSKVDQWHAALVFAEAHQAPAETTTDDALAAEAASDTGTV